MEVAGWFAAAMLLVVGTAWLQEVTGWPRMLIEKLYDGILWIIRLAMRHTGNKAYEYKGRRFR